MSSWDWSVPCTCHQCGRIFWPAEKKTWVFRRYVHKADRVGKEEDRLFCSWGCMRAYDKSYVPPISRRGRKKEAPA